MGGAQAGEVASEMAVESFDEGLPDGNPSETLAGVIRTANRRIHDRSRTDEQAAGMGTTCTAAYVGENDVTIAHVGDSRAYLWRDGELIRLTRDHSLVGELVARGKLTEEQAEAHPQRSVITRALGPEANVEVDVEVYGARDGDVYLLCSDGLTSMIHEVGVKPIMEQIHSLEQTGRDLIAAANAAGGRDNITVILFRLEEIERGAPAEEPGETGEFDTFSGEAVTEPRQGVTRRNAQPETEKEKETERDTEAHTRHRDELHADDVTEAVRAADDQEAAYRASGTVALSAVRPRAEPLEEAPPRTAPLPDQRRRRRRRRLPSGVLVIVVLLAMIVSGFWLASRAVYFVGIDEGRGNEVSIYRGLPVDLPLGVHLYSRYYGSGVALETIPSARRPTFTDHKLRSKDDAENLVIQLERGQIDS
jgi:PPM family protein phosphatase